MSGKMQQFIAAGLKVVIWAILGASLVMAGIILVLSVFSSEF